MSWWSVVAGSRPDGQFDMTAPTSSFAPVKNHTDNPTPASAFGQAFLVWRIADQPSGRLVTRVHFTFPIAGVVT
jgi:hypothetical protein